VAAQDFVVRRNEQFAKAVLFFHSAPFGVGHLMVLADRRAMETLKDFFG
jgi:hypothetical protein